jgi:hypothetical protein
VSLCVGDILCGLVVNRGDEISFSDASERRFAARVYPRYPEGLVEIGASVQPEPPRRTSVQDNFASCHGLLDIGVGPVGPQPTRSLAHSTLTLVGATIIDQNRHSADNARPWDLFRSPDDCSDWLGLLAGIFRCRCRMLTKRTSHCFSSETRFQHCPEHNSTPTRPSMVTSGTGGELVARDRLARSYFQFFTFISITTQDALAGLLRFTDTFGARHCIVLSEELSQR